MSGSSNTGLVVASTAIATTIVLSLLHRYLWPTEPKVARSPLKTLLPTLSDEEYHKLEYKPDNFPGARDVETPYGSIRVYEWGPLTGEKVLFVHGISTSCITLTKLAHALVAQKGCRVMLFDLFGRGFSDNPGDVQHDARLYTTQILLALASSPDLAWTGPGAFRLVGYSLGGGIAVHFAAAFPHLVSSLVLLAPAGLIRPEAFGVVARAVFASGVVPPRILAWIMRRRLRKPIRSSGKRGGKGKANDTTTAAADPTEIAPLLAATTTSSSDNNNDTTTLLPPLSPEPRHALEQRVLRAVHWQLAHHAGFVPAFMSCLRHGPMVGQEAAWRALARRAPGTTAVVLGRGDEIIDPDHYAADALPLAGGKGHVHWSLVPGGHDFPMSYAEETLEEIYKAWGWSE